VQNFDALPDDLAAAHAMILAERAARLEAEAQISGAKLEIERLKLLLARARREQFGQSSERGARIVAQLELQLSELEETEAETEVAAEIAASAANRPSRWEGTRKPARRPLPEHLPRERILYAAPCTCPKCGGPVRKLGEAWERRSQAPRPWSACRGAGRWSSMCARRSPAAAARRSASRRRPRTRSPVAAPDRTCSPWSWPPNTASTCR
jgi:transposase